MSLSARSCTLSILRSVSFALILATTSISGTRADVITVADMLHGIKLSAEQCARLPQAKWITALGHSYCMRYYLAQAGEDVKRPIVFLQGDRLGVLNLRTGSFSVPDGERDVNTDDLMRFATVLARDNKMTAIYLARVGVEGSSGDHRVRHSILELQATNAALDAIKQQYGFEGFNLIGQSGGAHLVAGLLGMRHDIGCAIIGSGPLAPVRRPYPLPEPGLEHFNPASNIAAIVRNRGSRIMVVTDPEDRKVNAEKQTAFVRLLQQAGVPAEQYLVQAVDENRHGVVAYARVALSGCLRNESAQVVAQRVERVVRQRVAAAKPKPERREDGSKDQLVGSGEIHGHPTEDAGLPPQKNPVERAPEALHPENNGAE